jgi:hypothetical protein
MESLEKSIDTGRLQTGVERRGSKRSAKFSKALSMLAQNKRPAARK